MKALDLKSLSLRQVNSTLQGASHRTNWTVKNPMGRHALAVGLNNDVHVIIDGSVGYYCGGMNKKADIVVNGSVGPGVAENMMSGSLHVKGNASQYAGASAHGGTLIIEGNSSSRCGISMKGIDIIVRGNVGHMSAFMAQAGNLVICGNAGDALGDSIYEANIFVIGTVKSLGADCIEKEVTKSHKAIIKKLLIKAEIDNIGINEFRRYGSARSLYNFNVDNAGKY